MAHVPKGGPTAVARSSVWSRLWGSSRAKFTRKSEGRLAAQPNLITMENKLVLRNGRKLLAVATLLAMSFGLAYTDAPAQAKGRSYDLLEVMGQLPETMGGESGFIVGINDERRLMYYMYRHGTLFYLREYDLRTEIPKLRREELMGPYDALGINFYSPYTIQIDTDRNLMAILSGHEYGSAIKFVDLKTLKLIGEWDLGKSLPGFVGQGLRLSPSDDRIYVIGSESLNGHGTTNRGASKPSQAAVVAAFDANVKPDEAPKLVWARVMPQCQQVMDTSGVGALVARSEKLPALYFACVRANPFPGQSGVVRLWIDPEADHAAAAEFRFEFFPVSGSYSSNEGIVGLAAFDPIRERFFVQSLSYATPGVWVLDGKIGAWIGLIASPDNSNRYFGLDASSGRYYLGGNVGLKQDGFIVVSDIATKPPSQGEEVGGTYTKGFITIDSRTRRLFFPTDLVAMGLYKGEEETMPGYIVVKDHSTESELSPPIDYDALTSNKPEGAGVVTSYSAGVNGFGARATVVGGYGGVLSASGQEIPLGQIRPGDRGITAARVPSLGLRSAGASASAQALVPDSNTEAELSQDGAPAWAWSPVTCLDGTRESGGEQTEHSFGKSAVECDLEKNIATASSHWGSMSAAQVSVGGASFEAKTWRDEKKGILSETIATADGIDIAVPGGGRLSIAHITARASTVAHGRAGSAKAIYERSMSGILLTDAEGKVVQRVAGCGTKEDESCSTVVDHLNDALVVRMKVKLPKPIVEATPKGAFASVSQGDGDFYEGQTMNNQGSSFASEAASRALPAVQVTLYNDSQEKSRLVAQFAAIQSNSIYTNTPYSELAPPKPIAIPKKVVDAAASSTAPSLGSGLAAGPSDLSPDEVVGPAASSPIDEPVAMVPIAAEPIDGVLAFMKRSPAEGLLVAAIWMTFLGGGVMAMRRRSLLALLEGNK